MNNEIKVHNSVCCDSKYRIRVVENIILNICNTCNCICLLKETTIENYFRDE